MLWQILFNPQGMKRTFFHYTEVIRAPAPPKNPSSPEQYLHPRAPKESSSIFKNEILFGGAEILWGRESPAYNEKTCVSSLTD